MVNAINYWYQKWLAERKKVAEFEEQLNTAKDYAFFAGSKAMRNKMSKLKEMADAMYHEAQYLTTDASRLHKAMVDYRTYTICELKEEII